MNVCMPDDGGNPDTFSTGVLYEFTDVAIVYPPVADEKQGEEPERGDPCR